MSTISTFIRKIARFGAYFLVNLYFRLLLFTPYRHLKKHLQATDGLPSQPSTARWIGFHVVHTARFVPGSTCLSRGLCARFFLNRKGYASRMLIGVASVETGMAAHAWVVSGHEVVVGDEDGQLKTYKLLADVGQPRA